MTNSGLPSNANEKEKRIDALSQVFALFKRNYHNQFFKAFSKESDLVAVKRLWHDALHMFDSDTITQAAYSLVKSSEFLPTLKTMLDHCERLSQKTLPDAHAAYKEACCASSPKANYRWSHPAVYLCGKEVGWQFLHSSPENIAFPIFKQHYTVIHDRIRSGEPIETPIKVRIERKKPEPASRNISEKYLSHLHSLMDDK